LFIDALPDMKDPTVLPLVLCLLEVNENDQNKHNPDTRATDEVLALTSTANEAESAYLSGSILIHNSRCSDFENSPGAEIFPPLNWVTMTCDVDPTFLPVKIDVLTDEDELHTGSTTMNTNLNPVIKSGGVKVINHVIMKSNQFGDFKGEMTTKQRPLSNSVNFFDNNSDPYKEHSTSQLISSSGDSTYLDESFESFTPLNDSADKRSLASRESHSRGSVPIRLTDPDFPSPTKRAVTPGIHKDSVYVIKKNEYSPTRPIRSGGTMTSKQRL
jgi:hypothetical protein